MLSIYFPLSAILGEGGEGTGTQENRGWEAGEERVGSRSSKKVGIIYLTLKYFQK